MPLDIKGTDYLKLPVGTKAQRPATPTSGMTRYNSTTGYAEYYNGSSWINLGTTSYSINYLVIAGGGGGGTYALGPGVGGAGGLGGGGTGGGSNGVSTSGTANTGGGGGGAEYSLCVASSDDEVPPLLP